MNIVGVWSMSRFSEGDGPGEDILTFRSDGTGRWDFGNYGRFDSHTFRWNCLSDRLTLYGVNFFSFSMIDPLHDLTESKLLHENVPFRIRTETTRKKRRIPVLHAKLFDDIPEEASFGLETTATEDYCLEKRLRELGAPR